MTEFEAQVLTDLHVLKSQMEQVMGIGQPGRLHQLEGRVSANEEGIQKIKGFVAAFSTALTMLHLVISYFAGKHN
jgi:hypothetical protein